MAAIALGLPLLGILLAFLRGPQFSAESSITPEASESSTSRLSGLAAQFGMFMGVGGGPIGNPVVFYGELLQSQEVLRGAAVTRYRFAVAPGAKDSLEGTLVELYRTRGASAEDRLRRTVDRLRRQILVSTYRDAGLVRLRTVARWPDLAVAVNRRLLELVADYNLQRRQSQAAAQRRFVESRMAEAKRELQDAEDDFQKFLERNRRYSNATELAVENSRFQRMVNLRQQVYVQLVQAFEQARIDEVRDTPVVTIVQPPEGTIRRYGNLAQDALLWVMLGVLLAAAAAVVGESWDGFRVKFPEEAANLRALRGASSAARLSQGTRDNDHETSADTPAAAKSPYPR